MSAEDFSTRESVNCQAIIEPVQERPIRIVRTLAVVPPKSDSLPVGGRTARPQDRPARMFNLDSNT